MTHRISQKPSGHWAYRFGIPAGLVLLALGARLIYLLQIRGNPFFAHPTMDPLYHHEWAAQIADGEWSGDEVFFRAPLYPYLLGLLYVIFGSSFFWVRFAQVVIGSVSCGLVYLLGERLFNRPVGIVAGVLAAFYGTLIYFDAELLIPVVAVFLNLLMALLLLRAQSSSRPLRWFVAGGALGLSAVARPNILLFVPVVCVWIAGHFWSTRRRVLVAAGAFLVGSMVAVGPVTLRNYLVGEDFVLIASQGGINFYIGNNPQSDGKTAIAPGMRKTWWGGYHDSVRIAQERRGRALKPSEVSDYWFGQGLRFIVEKPFQYIRLQMKKIALFWNGFEATNNESIYFFSRYSSLLRGLVFDRVLYVPFGLLGPLALVGIFLGWRDHRRKIVLPVLLVATYFVSVILFFVCARYRVPVLPFLIVFCSYTLWWMYRAIRRRAYRSLGWTLVLLTVLMIGANVNWFDQTPNWAQGYYNEALAYSETGQEEATLASYHRALQQNPRFPEALNNIGSIYMNRGDYRSAIPYFERAIQLRPSYAIPHNNLGLIYAEEGNYEQAAKEFQTVLRIFPHLTKVRERFVEVQTKLRRQKSEARGQRSEIRDQ